MTTVPDPPGGEALARPGCIEFVEPLATKPRLPGQPGAVLQVAAGNRPSAVGACRRGGLSAGLLSALLLLGAEPSAAHGLGERYALPLPLGLYLAGAGSVVALSFLGLVISARPLPQTIGYIPLPDRTLRFDCRPIARVLVFSIRTISAALFVLLVVAGLIGSTDPFKNPLPVSIWVIGWVGIAYLSAAVGNVWAAINPWDNLFRLGTWLSGRQEGASPPRAQPRHLGAWPAVALFFVFAWMELVWTSRDDPASLAAAIIAYSVITWSGMVLYGREVWLGTGEIFAVAFGLIARFAVVAYGRDGMEFRLPATGLILKSPASPSIAAFALLMLATVTFDGLRETPLWLAISDAAASSALVQGASHLFSVPSDLVVDSAGLLIFPLVFAGCYVAVAKMMALATTTAEDRVTTGEMARLFALTLVPIAIGYHLSHYLTYFLIAGQFIIPISSDPFSLGWNLFGTNLYLIDLSLSSSRFAWYLSLAMIVGGHVIAVWLVHIQARSRFENPKRVFWSEVPMAVLMVAYTTLSLWILAQPITD